MRCTIALAAVFATQVASDPAHAAKVLVFPLEAKGLPEARAAEATAMMEEALRSGEGVEVADATAVSKELGFDLGAQAKECAHDVLCLVQIGEVVEADILLLGAIQQTLSGFDSIRLSAVDVKKASLVDTVRWEVPPRQGALREAASAAARRLALPPDATVVFDVRPRNAELLLYGAPAAREPHGTAIRFWSGVYYGRASAPGYEPLEIKLTVNPGGPANLEIELNPDLLYVDPNSRSGPRSPEEPRAIGGGTDTPPPVASRPSPLANWIAWSIVAAGAGGALGGSLMMKGAQDDYNALSGEVRYTQDRTKSWAEAAEVRSAARDDFDLGAKVLYGGIGVAAIGVGWIIADAIFGGP